MMSSTWRHKGVRCKVQVVLLLLEYHTLVSLAEAILGPGPIDYSCSSVAHLCQGPMSSRHNVARLHDSSMDVAGSDAQTRPCKRDVTETEDGDRRSL
ncbi:uncharacterized protein LY89DRAFT_680416, partial [Mollisia scopiformis]